MREDDVEIKDKMIADLRPLYRGVWSENLINNQELPVGGSLFSDELTIKLKLDFDQFSEQTKNFTKENVRALYEQNERAVIDWLQKVGCDIDPYLFFVCQQVQQKMQKLLEVNPDQPDKPFERQQKYGGDKIPALSELKGTTMCAERTAMGQYLLQQAGIESAYINGITMQDAKDTEDWPEDHSYIVLKNSSDPEETYIFDIARPRSQNNLARVLKPVVPFNYELLKDKKELLVRAVEVLQGGELYFGVGAPVAGQHDIIESGKN